MYLRGAHAEGCGERGVCPLQLPVSSEFEEHEHILRFEHLIRDSRTANIGLAAERRYRRQDEIGTPVCITVDGQTAEDGTVTLRDRDTTEQVRVPAENVRRAVADRVAAWTPD